MAERRTGYGARSKGAKVIRRSGKYFGGYEWECRLCYTGGPFTRDPSEAQRGADAHNAENHPAKTEDER